MINGIQYKMICLKLYCLVTILSVTTGIRVDWNTNTGPIIPPTSTLPPIPQKPYRSPAPVWEDQSDDIPNPNPYQYVLPPPSRPKPATDNYARAPISTQQQQETYYKQQQQQQNYGQLITKHPNNNNNNNNIYYKRVPSLAVQYIPNFGFKYNAIVPSPSSSTLSGKSYYLKENDIYDGKFNGKLNGKYNAKLKKYKAYEKIKYFPQIYYTTPVDYDYFQQQLQQQLPYPQQQTQYNQQSNTQQIVTSTQQSFYQQLPPQQDQQSVAVTTSLDQTKPQTFTNSPHLQTTQTSSTNSNINNNSQDVTTKQQQIRNLENSSTDSSTNLR